MLTFVFDGVPEPGSEAKKKETPQESKGKAKPHPKAVINPFYVHAPFANRQCDACHSGNILYLQRSEKDKSKDNCFSCHEHITFRQKLDSYRYLHGPIAVETCSVCHDPHRSRYKGILVAADPKLCLICHTAEELKKSERHMDILEKPCLDCHVPHGSNEKYFLNEKGKQALDETTGEKTE